MAHSTQVIPEGAGSVKTPAACVFTWPLSFLVSARHVEIGVGAVLRILFGGGRSKEGLCCLWLGEIMGRRGHTAGGDELHIRSQPLDDNFLTAGRTGCSTTRRTCIDQVMRAKSDLVRQ
jgi:hypothetical protein